MSDMHAFIKGTGIALLAVLIVVTLPITMPIAFLQERLAQRKLERLVEAFTCVGCGPVLGAGALRLGYERWAAIVADMRKQHPTWRLRIVRTVHAVCPKCRREYLYVEKSGTLVAAGAE